MCRGIPHKLCVPQSAVGSSKHPLPCTQTLSAVLNSNWTNCYGQQDPAGFTRAIQNAFGIGFTFGGAKLFTRYRCAGEARRGNARPVAISPKTGPMLTRRDHRGPKNRAYRADNKLPHFLAHRRHDAGRRSAAKLLTRDETPSCRSCCASLDERATASRNGQRKWQTEDAHHGMYHRDVDCSGGGTDCNQCSSVGATCGRTARGNQGGKRPV